MSCYPNVTVQIAGSLGKRENSCDRLDFVFQRLNESAAEVHHLVIIMDYVGMSKPAYHVPSIFEAIALYAETQILPHQTRNGKLLPVFQRVIY